MSKLNVVTQKELSLIPILVGNVVDMSTTCQQQEEMSENSKKDTSVVNMVFFSCPSHVSEACHGH